MFIHVYTTYKNGDWGMVYYCFTHITQIDRDQNVALKNNGIQE
jgi:hypothetical protein